MASQMDPKVWNAIKAMDRMIEANAQNHADCLAVAATVQAMWDAGQREESQAYGATHMARLQVALFDAGARFEAAIVPLLGERRSAVESLQGYVVRLHAILNDRRLMTETQIRNGIAPTFPEAS